MCVIFVVGGVFTLFRSILFEMSGARVVARLRSQLFAAVIKQEVGFFDMNKTGELINRLSSDCVRVSPLSFPPPNPNFWFLIGDTYISLGGSTSCCDCEYIDGTSILSVCDRWYHHSLRRFLVRLDRCL